MLGMEGTRRLFGGSGWKGLLRAWAVGTVLPVCSLGVIPIAREMRRAGVPSGTILAFVLAAPHINPLSLLYGLTLSEPLVIICFAIASLVLALAAGAFWEHFLASEQDRPPAGDEPMPAPGLKRLAAVAITAGREAVSPTMGFVVLALFLTGLIAGLLPHGWYLLKKTGSGTLCGQHGQRRERSTALYAMLARASSGGHGHGFCGLRLLRFLPDQSRQAGQAAQPTHPILQLLPATYPQLAAGLLQTGQGVPTLPARCPPRPAADLTAFDVFPDVRLHGGGVQGHLRPLQHPQQVRLVLTHLFQHTVNAGIAGPLLDPSVETAL
jgi:hypothetical protein